MPFGIYKFKFHTLAKEEKTTGVGIAHPKKGSCLMAENAHPPLSLCERFKNTYRNNVAHAPNFANGYMEFSSKE
jgi:hypothetical protein